jgi:hypothetical protein
MSSMATCTLFKENIQWNRKITHRNDSKRYSGAIFMKANEIRYKQEYSFE